MRKTSKCKKRKLGKYEVIVVMNGKEIRAYADTGAEICIMCLENARKMDLQLEKTKMKIRRYGSKAKSCSAHYTGTIMFGDAVTNAKIYIISKKVETLLSGKVCEKLGIISMQRPDLRSVVSIDKPPDPQKNSLLENFPTLFKGVQTLHEHEVTFP